MSVLEVIEFEDFYFVKDVWAKELLPKKFISRNDAEAFGRSLIRAKHHTIAVVRGNYMTPLGKPISLSPLD